MSIWQNSCFRTNLLSTTANLLPARCLLRGQNKCKLPDPIMPIRLGTIYGTTLSGCGSLLTLSWSCVQWFPSVLDTFRKHLTGEQLATDTKWNQAVTCSLQKLHNDFFYARVKSLVPHGDISLNTESEYVESVVWTLCYTFAVVWCFCSIIDRHNLLLRPSKRCSPVKVAYCIYVLRQMKIEINDNYSARLWN